ncbi:hypothetical protein ECC02_008461 [Trypanosoma cruzi]|uniref:Uncharacterized protein n=1 Tax=Trypanosoma cruzi TaxID=5693 RepID=A0A7J6XWJ9_TRYCR|nr:hypothetical protein ECC02_008461 [Trypanosoma cruzi]
MAAVAAGGVWQKALAQLQARSWNVGRAPTARCWLDFFRFCATPFSTNTGQNRPSLLTSSLPTSVRLLIAESIMDVVRLARLQQLFSTSPGGMFCELQDGGRQGSREETAASFWAGGVPDDVNGVFLTTDASPSMPSSEMVEVLSHWCAAHEAPHDVAQLLGWLREAVGFLRFFTPQSISHLEGSAPPPQQQRRLYLTYSELLRVLHHGLFTFSLRPQANGVEHVSADVSVHEEVALLAIWLLQKLRNGDAEDGLVGPSNPPSSVHVDCNSNNNNNKEKALNKMENMLQETQMLLASRGATQAWLLHLPGILRDCGENTNGLSSGVVNDTARRIIKMQRRSPVCRIASELLLFTSSSTSSPNVCVPFVDRFALENEAAVYAMHAQLSSIAFAGKA